MRELCGAGAVQLKQEIEKSVLAHCGQAGLFAPENGSPRRVAAAVSGGADSMALLRVLLALREEWGLTVTACHVNHGLRGKAADADEAFVRAECERLGVPLTVFRAADIAPPPPNAGEDWARRLRYRCFERLAEDGDTLVATAHTLTDQAETLLFRLARGTGVHGAAGIPARRGVYVRPLLGLTRQQTEAYCAAVRQPFVTDETNLTDDYARNRLRHHALPALRTANAAAERNLGRFCERMARTDAYFSAEGRRLLADAAGQGTDPEAGPWVLEPLRAAHPLVLEAALHLLVAPVRDPEEKYIRLLAGVIHGGGAVQLTDTVRFAVQKNRLQKQTSLPERTAGEAPEIPLCPGQYVLPGGYEVEIGLVGADILQNTLLVHKKDLKNMADYAKIAMLPVVIRTRLPGDVFRPAGRGVSKTVKKLFNELGIPPRQRQQLPLLAAGQQILWLWDQGFAEGLAPDETTTTVLQIEQRITEDEKA